MPVEQEIPNIRPRALFRSRPENSVDIDNLTRGDVQQIRPKGRLTKSESRHVFKLVMDSVEASQKPYAIPPLAEGEEVTLIDQNVGRDMPFTTQSGSNLIVTRISHSLTSEAKLVLYVNGDFETSWHFDGYANGDVQNAGMFELSEVLTNLTGSNGIKLVLQNTSPGEVEGTVVVKTLQTGGALSSPTSPGVLDIEDGLVGIRPGDESYVTHTGVTYVEQGDGIAHYQIDEEDGGITINVGPYISQMNDPHVKFYTPWGPTAFDVIDTASGTTLVSEASGFDRDVWSVDVSDSFGSITVTNFDTDEVDGTQAAWAPYIGISNFSADGVAGGDVEADANFTLSLVGVNRLAPGVE